MKTREQVEALKQRWDNDPCWDIEDSEGFEEYHDELKVFSYQKKAEWTAAHKAMEHRTRMIRPDNPAFPCHSMADGELSVDRCNKGLNIRTQLAAMAMQGMLSGEAVSSWKYFPDKLAEHAVKCADALITELNKPAPEEQS